MHPSLTPPSRTRRSPEQWQTLIDEWQQSGESAKYFCVARSLSYASFCQWRRRLASSGLPCTQALQAAPAPGFIDLATLAARSASTWHIVLSLGNGVELTLTQR